MYGSLGHRVRWSVVGSQALHCFLHALKKHYDQIQLGKVIVEAGYNPNLPLLNMLYQEYSMSSLQVDAKSLLFWTDGRADVNLVLPEADV